MLKIGAFFAKIAGSSVFGFLAKHWQWIVIALLVGWIGMLKLSLKDEQLHGVKLSRALGEQVAANDKLRSDVTAKTALAKANDAAHSLRVERDQVVVSQGVLNAYQVQIADLRARAAANQRLRSAASSVSVGGRGGAPVPGVPVAAGGSDGSPVQDGFSLADRLTASEIAVRLQALQAWVLGEQAVVR